MSAVEKEVVETTEKEVVETTKQTKKEKFNPEVTVTGVSSSVDENRVKIVIPENSYVDAAKANGLEEDTIKRVQKFHTTYLKAAVGAVGNVLEKAYADHKDATGFDCNFETTLSTVNLFGDKHVTHTVKGVDYQGTGFSLKQEFTQLGLKAATNAAKAKVYASFNDK